MKARKPAVKVAKAGARLAKAAQGTKVGKAGGRVAKKVAAKASTRSARSSAAKRGPVTVAPLRPLQLPKQYDFKTSSGLQVVVAPRGTIPLAAIRLVIQGGGAVEPREKAGLADFTARLMRRGAGDLDADALNEAVEFVGANLGLGASDDQVDFAITGPAEQVPALLDVLGKMMTAPTFAESEVSSARERTVARITNDLDDPGALAERAFGEAMWGDHPYGHDIAGTPKSVASFTREDVVGFHRDHFGPRVSLLVVVGAVDPAQVHAAAEKAFAGWSGGPDAITVPTPLERAAGAGRLILVDKPDQTQSQVRIGTMTLQKTHPDYHAAVVANCVLGAGFTSRLVDEIRVNRGLSYGVSSYISPSRGGSSFGIDTFTKTSSTREIIDVALAEVSKIRERGVTQAELDKAKTYLCGLYPLRLETNESIAGGIADIRLSNLRRDWVETYRQLIQAVTRPQVAAAARAHLLKHEPLIVVVGNAAQVAPQLEGLLPVTIKKVTELG